MVGAVRLAGRDPDQVVASLARGLSRRRFVAADSPTTQRRIDVGNVSANWFLSSPRVESPHGKRSSADGAVARFDADARLAIAEVHNFWVFPVCTAILQRLIRRLLNAGFDASGAHSLFVVPAPQDRPELRAVKAEEMLPHIVHLPCYAEMPDRELRRLADAVRGTVRTAEVPSLAASGALADSRW